MTTNEYIRGVKKYGWVPFHGRLWQRNYYEHIVRDDNEMSRIREYIRGNPARWATDKDNPFTENKDS
jgi:REP element-mobilizing transposase RayT